MFGKINWYLYIEYKKTNYVFAKTYKANLRDLIAATSPVILLKLYSNHPFLAHIILNLMDDLDKL